MKNNFQTFQKYLQGNSLTIGEEDYLEMIYRLCLNEGHTRVSELANALHVKPPSASKMIRRLFQKNLIKHRDYGIIELTEEGNILGKQLYERHKSVEEFLRLLQVEENLLEETEKMEHTLSPETISRIKLLVSFFASDGELLHKLKEWFK